MLTSKPHPEYLESQNSPAQWPWTTASTCKAFPSLRKVTGLSLYAGEHTRAYKNPSKYGMAVGEEKVAGPLRC